jgi:DsbC/DsbD-like thiol-disulfide interchange protein/cytochrome c biogenesis protein CcdA
MFTSMKRLFPVMALVGALALLLAAITTARADAVFETPRVRAELMAEYPAVAPGDSLWVALALEVKADWHTYWRTPGDAGEPTSIRWSLPEGITAGDIHWPIPERIPYLNLMNFGYHGKVLLLTELHIDPDFTGPADIDLNADSTWLVCKEVCIMEDGTFTLPVRIEADPPPRNTAAGAAIAATRATLPQDAPWPIKVSRNGDVVTFTARTDLKGSEVTEAIFFPHIDGVIENAAPQDVRLSDGELKITTTTGYDADNIAEISGLLVLRGSAGGGESAAVGYTFSSPIVWTGPGTADVTNALPIGLAILFAFLGGIILNAMPCVLPVLVMKALSFMERSTTDAGALRRDGLAYTAGVMIAFGALVGMLLGFRAGGDAVGWGFQLQTPAFVVVLAYVMLAIGLNLSSVFTISGGISAGQNLTMHKGPTGAFFTGMLAVVVATPCTAPFMGAAIGFALTQPPVMAVLVFEALALGLALPYLVLAFAPGAAKALPRPGPWMDRLKQILAFPMYGVAAWLFWVLAQQVDSTGLAAALSGFVLIGFAAWLWNAAATSSKTGRWWSAAAALTVTAVIALVFVVSERPPVQVNQAATSDGISEPYSQSRLAALRAESRPVFVNFTAAWCITCKVNELVALSSTEVAEAFLHHNVAYLKADWTNRNAELGTALRALGRNGVPLYALYLPGSKDAQILPQILTPGTLVEALESL